MATSFFYNFIPSFPLLLLALFANSILKDTLPIVNAWVSDLKDIISIITYGTGERMNITHIFTGSMQRKIGSLLGLMLIIVLGQIGSVMIMLSTQEKDSLAVNMAGRERMLSQKMAKYAILMADGDVNNKDQFTAAVKLFDQSLKQLKDGSAANGLPPASQQVLPTITALEEAWTPFAKALDTIQNSQPGSAAASDALKYIIAHNEDVLNAADKMTTAFQTDAEARIQVAKIFLYITLGLGLLIFAFAFWVLQRLIRPLRQMLHMAVQIATTDLPQITQAVDELSRGNLAVRVHLTSKPVETNLIDESGKLAEAFNQMISHLHDTGNAFNQMTQNLQNLVQQVIKSSDALIHSSMDLASSAEQTRDATSQIALTMQQIASGTSQQAESATHTAISVEEVTHMVDQVAHGASKQASAVSKASDVTGQLSSAIEQVSQNIKTVSKDSTATSGVAQEGVLAVNETIKGMQEIKIKVGTLAEKVTEMSTRSDRIGIIVETIEDIAAQTNLLALNAAIEAARAGEAGKGFAVVADEVRRLADRAGTSAKEVSRLVENMRAIIAEAIIAVEEGTREVDSGVVRANTAGLTLEKILGATETVYQQAEQAAQAASKMSTSASELVSAVDSVYAVVEENTQATKKMAMHTTRVTESIENIASVSEENSAAVEEVTASTDNMNHQVEMVAASARSLATLADGLQKIVSQFKLA
jgi:methyl-accepting chemotaxis protein